MAQTEALRGGFGLGEWQVLPERNLLLGDSGEVHVERLAMDVLVVLAARQGDLVSKDDLIELVWDGRPQMDDVITQKISLIRKALGDASRPHRYVETIFGRGYRMKMPISLPEAEAAAREQPERMSEPPPRSGYLLALAGGAAAIAAVFLLLFFKPDAKRTDSVDAPMRSVVVFPFQCTSADDAFLCYGFSATLISTLAQLDGLQVVKSRTKYPEDRSDQQVAEEFGVEGVIWGNVNRVGNTLLINADLVDGRTGFVEFSQVYNSETDNILETQEQVANEVRRSIRGDESPVLRTSSGPASFEVLELFWRADYEFSRRSSRSIYKAIDLYEKAIEGDASYGPAYVRLAYATALLPDYNSAEDRFAMYDLALKIAAEGVVMDSSIEFAAATVNGFVHHKRGDWIAAQDFFERSLAGGEDLPETHLLLSRLLASVGRLEDSLEQARQARDLDPESAVLISRLAISNYWMNSIERARYLFELKAEQPEVVLPINDLTHALLLVGEEQYDEAARVAKTALDNVGVNSEWLTPVFAGLQDPQARATALDEVSLMADKQLVPPLIQITLWTLFDEIDEAMEIAWSLDRKGLTFEVEILFSPEFRKLRQHRDFPLLMEAIGITAYWKREDCSWEVDTVHCSDGINR